MEFGEDMEEMVRNLFGDGALEQPGAQPGRAQPGRGSPRYPPGFEPRTGVPDPAIDTSTTTPAQHSTEKVMDSVSTVVYGTPGAVPVGPVGKVDLGTTHFQCCAARAASSQIEATSISIDSTFGSSVKLDPENIGSLNPEGDMDVGKTFRGARIKRGGETVNQSVTMSIDPSTLVCVTCDTEHPVINSPDNPVVVILSDQNFVPVWPGQCGVSSVVIIRMVDPTLTELTELLMEIFEKKNLPDGSMVLLSSVSYLHRVGTGYYAREWTEILSRMGRRWPNVRVGPLAPLIRENCNGGVVREIVELGSWLSKVYTGNPNGLQQVWNKTVTRTIERSAGQTVLNTTESYTLSLPSSLEKNSPDKPCTLYTTSSRPSILYGLDQGIVDEVLGEVMGVLSRDFNIPTGTRSIPVSARAGDLVQENIKRVVLVGASILKYVAVALRGEGFEVIDLCVPGWSITPGNVDELLAKLKNCNPGNNAIFILDLFGNSCSRTTLFDGSTIMPMKGAGGYHLPGTVNVCSDEVFNKLVDIVIPVIESIKGHSQILLPPMPRYLFSKCCNDQNHCINVGTSMHSESLLAATFRLRALLKRKLAGRIPGTYWVMETCCMLQESGDLTVSEKLSRLKMVCGSDGVHLKTEGTLNVAKNIVSAVQKIQLGVCGKSSLQNKSAAVPISGDASRHFWRGFASPVGSKKQPWKQSWAKYPREKTHWNSGPYQRRGGGGGGFWKN